MSDSLPPIPTKAQLIDENGMMSPIWIGFFQRMFTRVGGYQSLSNAELSSSLTDGLDQLDATITSLTGSTADSIAALSQGPNL